jgi:hypothetical protein
MSKIGKGLIFIFIFLIIVLLVFEYSHFYRVRASVNVKDYINSINIIKENKIKIDNYFVTLDEKSDIYNEVEYCQRALSDLKILNINVDDKITYKEAYLYDRERAGIGCEFYSNEEILNKYQLFDLYGDRKNSIDYYFDNLVSYPHLFYRANLSKIMESIIMYEVEVTSSFVEALDCIIGGEHYE